MVGGGEVTGRKADVLMAAHLASEAAIRLIKPGGKNWDVTDAVQKIAESFGCKPCEGILSHSQERNVVDGVALPGIDMERKERTDLDEYTLLACA